MSTPCISGPADVKTLTSPPAEPEPTPEQIQQEVRKYLRLFPTIPEPNLSRVFEIKEEIKKGTYPTQEMIEETASRLTLRFLRKE